VNETNEERGYSGNMQQCQQAKESYQSLVVTLQPKAGAKKEQQAP
jgi:hypothetical protein